VFDAIYGTVTPYYSFRILILQTRTPLLTDLLRTHFIHFLGSQIKNIGLRFLEDNVLHHTKYFCKDITPISASFFTGLLALCSLLMQPDQFPSMLKKKHISIARIITVLLWRSCR
jgi:hypothetical protein